jgi:segregation and condensation protein B
VVVSTNIVRTLLERNWIRVVGHRDVPGKPAMFGTTKEFLDYFGLKKLEELPTLAELKDGMPELSPQSDLLETLEAEARGLGVAPLAADGDTEAAVTTEAVDTMLAEGGADDAEDETELAGADLFGADGSEKSAASEGGHSADEDPSESAQIIPLRASDDP